MIVRKGDIKEGRTDLCPTEQFLQCAALRLPQGTTFKAHRHITKPATHIMPEESWVIRSGAAQIEMYDTDGTYLASDVLFTDDVSFTFNGAGHNYVILTEGFEALEFKSSPYLGVEADKIFL
jgi:hypothetical protein